MKVRTSITSTRTSASIVAPASRNARLRRFSRIQTFPPNGPTTLRKTAFISTSRVLLTTWVCFSAACVSAKVEREGGAVPAATRQTLSRLMDESAVAWNRGDLDSFLATYKDDNQTAFMAPQITYGLADIKARYARSYFKDGKPKAQLSFGDLKFRQLGAGH